MTPARARRRPAPPRRWQARIGEAVLDLLRAACLAVPLGIGVDVFGADLGYAGNERTAAWLTGIGAAALVLLLARVFRARPLREARPRADGRITAAGFAVLALAFAVVAWLLWSMTDVLRHALAGSAALLGMAVLAGAQAVIAWRRMPGPFRR